MRGRKSAQELAGPRDRLRRLIAKVHAANRPHLQRVKMSIEEIARDRLGGDVEPDFTRQFHSMAGRALRVAVSRTAFQLRVTFISRPYRPAQLS
jgi:hypothetical protein